MAKTWFCWLVHIFVRNANNIKKGNYCLDCGYGKSTTTDYLMSGD